DALDPVPQPLERRLDRLDGVEAIELGGLFVAIAFGEIVVAEIAGDADAHGSLRGVAHPDSVGAEASFRIRIAVDVPLEVAKQEIPALAADDIIRDQRDLAAAARRIDNEVRDRIAGRVAAQGLDDLDALLHRGAEMRRAGDRVALIEVI